MRQIIAAFKMLAFLILTLLIVPTQMIVMLFTKGPKAHIVPQLWHLGVCKIFGISVDLVGSPSFDSQTIFMINHLSYLDIPLLGSFVQPASFVAKSEVARWPVFGFLSRLQQTAYIERRRTAIKEESDKIRKVVSARKNMIIFPEGTSTDGVEVYNFKSSLFLLAIDNDNPDLLVQPAAISLVTVDGKKPGTIEERRTYTWPAEDPIELPEHLWRFACSKGAHLKVVFYDPLQASDFEDRKTLAKTCHDIVSNGLEV